MVRRLSGTADVPQGCSLGAGEGRGPQGERRHSPGSRGSWGRRPEHGAGGLEGGQRTPTDRGSAVPVTAVRINVVTPVTPAL